MAMEMRHATLALARPLQSRDDMEREARGLADHSGRVARRSRCQVVVHRAVARSRAWWSSPFASPRLLYAVSGRTTRQYSPQRTSLPVATPNTPRAPLRAPAAAAAIRAAASSGQGSEDSCGWRSSLQRGSRAAYSPGCFVYLETAHA